MALEKTQYLMYFLHFNIAICYSLIAPIIPTVILDKGGNSFVSGLYISTFSFTQLISILFAKSFVKMIGRQRHFFIFIIIQTIVTLMYSILPNFNGAFFYFISFLIRALHGLSDGAIVVPAFGLTNIISKGPNLENALGLIEFAGMFGEAVGPIIISIFYAIGGYPLPFIVATLISTIAIIWVTKADFNIKEEESEVVNDERKTILPYTKNFNIFIIIVLALINFGGRYIVYPTLTNFLNSTFNITIEASSNFFMVSVLSYWACLYYIKRQTEFFGKKVCMILGLFITMIGCLFIAPMKILPHSLITIIVGLLFQGYGGPLVNINVILEITFYLMKDFNLGENDSGEISSAIYIMSFNIGYMIAPPIGGLIASIYDYETSCYFGALTCLIMIIIYYISYSNEIKPKIKELLKKEESTKNSINIKENFLNNSNS